MFESINSPNPDPRRLFLSSRVCLLHTFALLLPARGIQGKPVRRLFLRQKAFGFIPQTVVLQAIQFFPMITGGKGGVCWNFCATLVRGPARADFRHLFAHVTTVFMNKGLKC